jgi:excisionase family DNA binding protein
LRVRKPKSGEHGCRTPEEALAVMRSMATRWSDEDIAASLNRMGMPTGQGKTWIAHRVGSLRRVHGIHAYRSAEKNGAWLTMSEAATTLGVSRHRIRRLIKDGIVPAEQAVPGAPYQIRASDLHHERVTAAIARTAGPCRAAPENQRAMFTGTCERDAQ